MELPEAIESALVTCLQTSITAAPAPDYFDPATQIRAGESDETISGQIIRCICGDADQEYPQGTGNFWHPILVELLTPVAEQMAAEAASAVPEESTSALDKHKAMAALLQAAIMVDDLPGQLTGALNDFTCLGILDRLPQRQQTPLHYVSGFTFRCYAASSDMTHVFRLTRRHF